MKDYVCSGVELMSYGMIIKQLLCDLQQRLVFRAQVRYGLVLNLLINFCVSSDLFKLIFMATIHHLVTWPILINLLLL